MVPTGSVGGPTGTVPAPSRKWNLMALEIGIGYLTG
jgi:hypothetical protein